MQSLRFCKHIPFTIHNYVFAMKTTSILLAIAFTVSTAFAAPMHKDRTNCSQNTECKKMKLTEEQKQKIQEFKVEMKEYKNSEILPAMTEWKKQLDAAMTSEDLTKLNELRQKAETFRSKLAQSMKDMQVGNKDGLKDIMISSKNEMQTIMEELKPLAEKYKATLENLMETAKPTMDKWKEDAKEIHQEIIVETFKNEEQPCNGKMKKHHRMHIEKFPMSPLGPMGHKNRGGAAMFMLWNGQSELFDTNEETIVASSNDGNVSKSGLTLKQNTPNPSNATTSFSFVLDKPATVSMKLYDVNGNEVLTIVNNVAYAAGEHTVNADVRNLPVGSYFYRLTSGTVSLQKNMSVTR
jgi:hypothetical protein